MEKDFTEEIRRYVRREIRKLNKNQRLTLRALLFAGYKGEREQLILELLKFYGLSKVENSSLIETFTLHEETKESKSEKIRYYRIKPEYYRAVREILLGRG